MFFFFSLKGPTPRRCKLTEDDSFPFLIAMVPVAWLPEVVGGSDGGGGGGGGADKEGAEANIPLMSINLITV